MKKEDKKLTTEEFVLLAISKLSDEGRSTIHTVYSGFNKAFRGYFPRQDPVKEIKRLTLEGKISFRICPGGAIIALPGVITTSPDTKDVLKKMGL